MSVANNHMHRSSPTARGGALTAFVAIAVIAVATWSAIAVLRPRIDHVAVFGPHMAGTVPHDPAVATSAAFAALQRARETGDPSHYAQAEQAFNRALQDDPNDLNAIVGSGSLALSRHQFAHALQLGERAQALNPNAAPVYGVIGDAEIELGRYDEAVATVQRMVDLRPDLASYSRVSYLRELYGDLDGAIEAMAAAVSAGAGTAENTEYVRVQLGNLYFGTGDLDAAERTYQLSLAHLPDYHFALAGLARVQAARGDLNGAVDLYARAAARLPLPELVIGLGESLEAAGRPDEAADQYALVGAMQQLFAANGVRNDLELAAFFADHGDADEAVTLALAGYAERPTVFAADTVAWALHRAGRSAEALPYVKEALRLGTQNSRLLYHAGVIEAAAGQIDLARQHLEQALALNPAFSPLDAPRAAAAFQELDR
jgi:tetratricopeptide (TPR) repeat protein